MAIIPNTLILDIGVSPNQVRRLSGGTSTSAIGGNLSPCDEYNDAGAVVGNNRVVQYRRFLVAKAGRTFDLSIYIWSYDFNTGTWTNLGIITTGGGGIGNTVQGSGVFVLNGASGQLAAGFVVQQSGGGQPCRLWTWDGTTFSVTAVGTGFNSTAGRSLKWRNTIYQVGYTYVGAGAPLGGTYTQIAPSAWTGGSASNQGALCVFRDRLFCLRHPSTGAAPTLYELVGGTFVSLGTMPGAGSGTTTTMLDNCNHALFPVGNTKMVAVYLSSDGTNHGTRAADITPSGSGFSFTDVTTALIPSSLQPSATSAKQNHAWEAFVDNDTDPTAPAIFLWHKTALGSGGSGTFYPYVDSSTTLSGTASVSGQHLLASDCAGGGERVNFDTTVPDTDLQAIMTAAPVGILGGVRLSFRVNGGTNGSGGRRTDVRLATIAALPANTPAGTGVGKTLTGNANGALSIDGTAVAPGDRVLVKNEVSAQHNGIYVVTAAGDGSNPFVLTRATDFDQATAAEVSAGAWCRVTAGGTLSTTYWQMSQTAAITVDTTTLPWLQLLTRFVRVYYNALNNTDQAQGTLQGTPTGLPWVVRNGNVIEGIIADDNTVYTLDWSIGAGPNSFVIQAGVV